MIYGILMLQDKIFQWCQQALVPTQKEASLLFMVSPSLSPSSLSHMLTFFNLDRILETKDYDAMKEDAKETSDSEETEESENTQNNEEEKEEKKDEDNTESSEKYVLYYLIIIVFMFFLIDRK